jgi:hypothetical protein
MRILHTIFSLDPSLGGPSKACLEMCKELSQNNEITICSTNYFLNKKSKESFNSQIQSLPKSLKIYLFDFHSIMRGFYFSFQMLGWLKKNIHHFDLLHAHSLFLFHSIAIFLTLFPYTTLFRSCKKK